MDVPAESQPARLSRNDSRCDVLHVVWPGDYNGVLTHVAGFVRAAQRDGGLVHHVCFLEGAGPIADALMNEGMAFRLHFRRGWGPLGLWRFARRLRAARPQIVHFHWRAFGAIGVAALVLPRTPFVWTEHHEGPVISSPPARVFYRFLRRRFSRFVVTSETMARYVEPYGVARELIDVIPYAVAVPFRRPATPLNIREPVIGVVTRIAGRKRIDLFIDVIAELRRRGITCSGLVVGDGAPKEELEKYAQKLGLGGIIQFVGVKTDVTSWLDRFDVFLSTSAVDTFGIASLEAMARGVPVIAMPCPGGLPELVERGGVLARDREPRTAADAVERLLASPEERLRVGRRGYRVATEHTQEAAVSKHLKMYSDVGARPVREKPVQVTG